MEFGCSSLYPHGSRSSPWGFNDTPGATDVSARQCRRACNLLRAHSPKSEHNRTWARCPCDVWRRTAFQAVFAEGENKTQQNMGRMPMRRDDRRTRNLLRAGSAKTKENRTWAGSPCDAMTVGPATCCGRDAGRCGPSLLGACHLEFGFSLFYPHLSLRSRWGFNDTPGRLVLGLGRNAVAVRMHRLARAAGGKSRKVVSTGRCSCDDGIMRCTVGIGRGALGTGHYVERSNSW